MPNFENEQIELIVRRLVRVFTSLCIPIAKAFGEEKKLNKGICLTKKKRQRGRERERERKRVREIKIKN